MHILLALGWSCIVAALIGTAISWLDYYGFFWSLRKWTVGAWALGGLLLLAGVLVGVRRWTTKRHGTASSTTWSSPADG